MFDHVWSTNTDYTRYMIADPAQDALEILKPDEVLKVGGAGHKVLLLMEGQAEAYVFPSPGAAQSRLELSTNLREVSPCWRRPLLGLFQGSLLSNLPIGYGLCGQAS